MAVGRLGPRGAMRAVCTAGGGGESSVAGLPGLGSAEEPGGSATEGGFAPSVRLCMAAAQYIRCAKKLSIIARVTFDMAILAEGAYAASADSS